MILERYLTKEIGITFLGVISVLLFIALCNEFASLLSQAASGQIPISLVLKIVGLYIPELFAQLMPLAFFVALLFALGRLFADSEMIILFCSGYSWLKLLKLLSILSLLLTVFGGYLTLDLLPRIVELREETFAKGEAIGLFQSVTPGRFQTMNDGKVVFYIENKDPNETMEKIFIGEQNIQEWTIITAQTASMKKEKSGQGFYLTLNDGFRYTGQPGLLDFTQIYFKEYGREIETKPGEVVIHDRLKPTKSLLLASASNGEIAEFQWRCSIPLSTMMLMLIGIPLSRVNPRKGRFGKFLPAIIIYIVYFNLLTMAKRAVGQGHLSPSIGLWGVHAIFLSLGVVLLLHVSGRLHQWMDAWNKKAA